MNKLKQTIWALTMISVFASAQLMGWALVLRQFDGVFWYGMVTMLLGVLWKLETKHWF